MSKRDDGLPPIAGKMMDLLSDGESHTLDELKDIVGTQADGNNVQWHLSFVRRYLAKEDRAVLCSGFREKDKPTHYRIVTYSRR